MNNLIAIVLGEPNSVNTEIIVKSWKNLKHKKKLFVIGNVHLFKKQLKNIKLKKKIFLNSINNLDEIVEKKINILNVNLSKNNSSKEKYIFSCLQIAHKLAIEKKIIGFVNAPIEKKIFKGKFLGLTEYLAFKNKVLGKEIMLIYNKKLSVIPLTTHLEIKDVTNNISSKLIKDKIILLSLYYKKLFKKKPKIALLGLNPHNNELKKNSVEKKIIIPSLKYLKKKNIKIYGPFSSDTAFMKKNRNQFNVIVGMYHDQVLAPFKALYEFDAINITLGLKYLRVSPDHGTASNLIGKNKANPQSLISAIKFLNKFKNL